LYWYLYANTELPIFKDLNFMNDVCEQNVFVFPENMMAIVLSRSALSSLD
jgi:hypothetical protein